MAITVHWLTCLKFWTMDGDLLVMIFIIYETYISNV